jgi:glucose/arabinose dehydrogenase
LRPALDEFMVTLAATTVASGLDLPVFATAPRGDTGRLFIVEQQTGNIRILDLATGQLLPTPFLTITDLSDGNEQGLLGLAFHPQYADNGLLYVDYTDAAGNTQIKRFRTRPSSTSPIRANQADPASQASVLSIPQPFSNHNGGWIGFGPDGLLYVATGDGGSGNDPGNRAQNLAERLGKLLRIDVNRDDFPDAVRNYGIPASNPFVATPGTAPEIWAYGLRNPWRCSFDRQTGDLFIADVGQSQREEVNVQSVASPGGENYGWRLKEGTLTTGLDPIGGHVLVDPVHEYSHPAGIAIVGGYVYRGAASPALAGRYLFADHNGRVWSLRYSSLTGAVDVQEHTSQLFPTLSRPRISSFGEDASGELYLVRHDGVIMRLSGT